MRWRIYVINSVDNTKLPHSNEVYAYFVLIMFLHVFSRGIVENKYATKNYEIFHFSCALLSDSGEIPMNTIRKCFITSINNGPQRAL